MTRARVIAATTFTKTEVFLVHSILEVLRRGGDVSILMRNPAFATFAGKILKMKRKYEEAQS